MSEPIAELDLHSRNCRCVLPEVAVNTDNLISIDEAVSQGQTRLRMPKWANKYDHLRINVVNNEMIGIWGHLHSPANLAINGEDPVSFPVFGVDRTKKEWVIYDGALPDSEEYKSSVADYDGILANA